MTNTDKTTMIDRIDNFMQKHFNKIWWAAMFVLWAMIGYGVYLGATDDTVHIKGNDYICTEVTNG